MSGRERPVRWAIIGFRTGDAGSVTGRDPVATYKDIQRATGLSLATISKFYNGGTVRPENGAAIEAAADSLGYRVNVLASNLRSGQTRTVGVTLPSLANQFHQSIIAGVERELRDDGISLIVTSSESPSPTDAIEFLLGRRVDGIIAVPTPAVAGGLEEATRHGVPVVTIDWSPGTLAADSVQLDNFAAGRVVAQHLIDHGHHNVGVVAGDDTVSSVHDRALGFKEMLGVRGIALDPSAMGYGVLSVESGYESTMALLQLVDRPTAIFAVNYELTVGALIAVNESGLRLGRGISLVGFDAADLARVTEPRLTVVTQPVDKIASEAARFLRARMAGDTGPFHRALLSGDLRVGGSVASMHA